VLRHRFAKICSLCLGSNLILTFIKGDLTMSVVAYSFLGFLVLFILIGVSSVLKSQKNNSDYLLAGHGIAPWLAALSAVATNNSGYMFIGLIGFTYTAGLQSVWIMFGWILGDYAISKFVHLKLRENTEKQNLLSFGGVMSRWYGAEFTKLRKIVGIVFQVELELLFGRMQRNHL